MLTSSSRKWQCFRSQKVRRLAHRQYSGANNVRGSADFEVRDVLVIGNHNSSTAIRASQFKNAPFERHNWTLKSWLLDSFFWFFSTLSNSEVIWLSRSLSLSTTTQWAVQNEQNCSASNVSCAWDLNSIVTLAFQSLWKSFFKDARVDSLFWLFFLISYFPYLK